MMDKEFLSQLRRYFDLNLYEVKLWAALLSRGVSTAGELSDISNVPRSRTYDVLESLEKKGFVVMKLGKPIKYIAINPGEVVERVQKNMRLDAEEKVKRLENIKGSKFMQDLEMLHSQGIELIDPTDIAGAIKGRHNVYSQLDLSIKNAEKTITLVTSTQGLIRKEESLKESLEKAKKRGVKIRIAAPLNQSVKKAYSSLKNIADIRHSDKFDARFCIVDGKDMLLMLMDDKDVHPTYDTGVWIKTPYFASAVDNLFDAAWKGMKPGDKALK